MREYLVFDIVQFTNLHVIVINFTYRVVHKNTAIPEGEVDDSVVRVVL